MIRVSTLNDKHHVELCSRAREVSRALLEAYCARYDTHRVVDASLVDPTDILPALAKAPPSLRASWLLPIGSLFQPVELRNTITRAVFSATRYAPVMPIDEHEHLLWSLRVAYVQMLASTAEVPAIGRLLFGLSSDDCAALRQLSPLRTMILAEALKLSFAPHVSTLNVMHPVIGNGSRLHATDGPVTDPMMLSATAVLGATPQHGAWTHARPGFAPMSADDRVVQRRQVVDALIRLSDLRLRRTMLLQLRHVSTDLLARAGVSPRKPRLMRRLLAATPSKPVEYRFQWHKLAWAPRLATRFALVCATYQSLDIHGASCLGVDPWALAVAHDICAMLDAYMPPIHHEYLVVAALMNGELHLKPCALHGVPMLVGATDNAVTRSACPCCARDFPRKAKATTKRAIKTSSSSSPSMADVPGSSSRPAVLGQGASVTRLIARHGVLRTVDDTAYDLMQPAEAADKGVA